MHFVYILRCADDSFYIGETADLAVRVAKHNEGSAAAFTAKRCPVTLAFSETHHDRPSALVREQQIKRWTRAKKEALIDGDLARLKRI